MSGRLGVALLGAGVVGQLRARALRSHPRAELRAVADLDPHRAAAAARPHGASHGDDPRRALESPGVEAVVVSTPLPSHEELVAAALEAGHHVLCEKPLAPTAAGCRALVESARRLSRVLAVGFNHRFFPSLLELESLLAGEGLGRLDHLRAVAGHRGLPELREPWMYRGELSGGGAMMDIGLHLTDLVRHLAGEVTELSGDLSAGIWGLPGSEDRALLLMRTASGLPVAYQASWSCWRGYRFRIEVVGDRGMATAGVAPLYFEHAPRDGRRRRSLYLGANLLDRLFGWQRSATESFRRELDAFARTVAGESTRIASGFDGLRAVEIAEAAREGSSEARSVDLVEGPS